MTAGPSKPIRFSAHAHGHLARRGFTEAEVIETIHTAPWRSAHSGRLEAESIFPYNSLWNGTFYAHKRIRPIFIDNPAEIVVITVYTYFF